MPLVDNSDRMTQARLIVIESCMTGENIVQKIITITFSHLISWQILTTSCVSSLPDLTTGAYALVISLSTELIAEAENRV
jgi:hypothetical protein